MDLHRQRWSVLALKTKKRLRLGVGTSRQAHKSVNNDLRNGLSSKVEFRK